MGAGAGAAKDGDIAEMRSLLKSGISVNVVTPGNITPLM
jgi:hypothetical protein